MVGLPVFPLLQGTLLRCRAGDGKFHSKRIRPRHAGVGLFSNRNRDRLWRTGGKLHLVPVRKRIRIGWGYLHIELVNVGRDRADRRNRRAPDRNADGVFGLPGPERTEFDAA